MHDTLLVYHHKQALLYAELLAQAGYPGRVLHAATPEEGARLVSQADLLLAEPVPVSLLAAASRLRWIQSIWAGVEQWLALPLPRRVLLTHMVGPYGSIISEYIFAYLLADLKQIDLYQSQQAEKHWQQHPPARLAGRRLGIAGMGAIGTEVARVARAFGMEVWGLSRTGGPQVFANRMFRPEQICEFASGLEYLVAVLPSTPTTRGLIDAEVFAALPPAALFINVGRGATVDEEALIRALQDGHLRGAVLDVFTQEPLPPTHPFWSLPNCVVTPHVSGLSIPEEMVAAFLQNYRRYTCGQPLLGVVDRQRGY